MKNRFFIIMSAIFLLPFFSSNLLFAQSVDKMEKRLKSINIEHIVVEDATIEAVIKLLRFEAKRADPKKTGVNIVTFLQDPKKEKTKIEKRKSKKDDVDFLSEEDDELKDIKKNKKEKTYTLMLDDVNLYDAIKNICIVADLKFRVEEYAVVIAHKNFPMDPVQTKIYAVSPDVFREIIKRMEK